MNSKIAILIVKNQFGVHNNKIITFKTNLVYIALLPLDVIYLLAITITWINKIQEINLGEGTNREISSNYNSQIELIHSKIKIIYSQLIYLTRNRFREYNKIVFNSQQICKINNNKSFRV